MTRTVTLRPWQKAALEHLAASTSPDFLAVATPGAGKTTFALTAARQAMAADPRLRLLVVVPTAHLKLQWGHAASAFDLHLDWRWSPVEGALPGVERARRLPPRPQLRRPPRRGPGRPAPARGLFGRRRVAAPRLRQAHDRLLEIRRRQPNAGGLVIATDQEHAKGIARLLADRLKVRAVVATSDDPDASARIAAFGTGTDPWIVAVRMVAEGVDIPRLRVGVFATTTTTELFFRQAVGRLVRWTRGTGRQHSFLYIPDEPRLRARAFAIAEQRRHSLRHEDRELGDRQPADEGVDGEQFSLFAPISAVPLDGAAGRTGPTTATGPPSRPMTPPSPSRSRRWPSPAGPSTGALGASARPTSARPTPTRDA